MNRKRTGFAKGLPLILSQAFVKINQALNFLGKPLFWLLVAVLRLLFAFPRLFLHLLSFVLLCLGLGLIIPIFLLSRLLKRILSPAHQTLASLLPRIISFLKILPSLLLALLLFPFLLLASASLLSLEVLSRLKKKASSLSFPRLHFPRISPSQLKLPLPRLPKPKFNWLKSFRLPHLTRLKLPHPPHLKLRFLLFLFLASIFFGFIFWFRQTILKDLPQPDRLIARPRAISTKIYARDNQLLYTIFREQNRSLIELKELPPYLIQATIAIEDAEFYSHYGFSPRAILRSIIKNFQGQSLQGGSTITQQLVKNTLLNPERTFKRKLRELILSFQVELKFKKAEILQMYFNEVPYGGATYGIQEASFKYFGKPATNLTLSESALLAGLPASPTLYYPLGARPELAKQRQILVLNRMVEEHFISPEEAEKAKETELKFAPQENNLLAPHFVMFVKDYLAHFFPGSTLEESGLAVTTSLDLTLQQEIGAIVQEELTKLAPLNVTNAAVLVTKPQTGEILAMIGSRNYFDLEQDGNVNVALRPRQPGSAIKPVNYAVALQKGYTPASIISDTPITYRVPGQPPYSPQNYDGRFHGNVSLRTALASSYNVPAVKVLSSYGLDQMVTMGQNLGITTWDNPERFGLSLTLGGGEVTLLDLATAYGTFANLGQKTPLRPVLAISDYQEQTYQIENLSSQETPNHLKNLLGFSDSSNPSLVLSPQIAYLLTHILSDNQARTPAFGPNSYLNIPNFEVAVKTGTTNNLRDNWTIGYSPEYLVAVWVGNNDNSPMNHIASGLTGASPIWNKTIKLLLSPDSPRKFIRPEGIIEIDICAQTNTLPCPNCPRTREIFLTGTQPQQTCQFPTPTSQTQPQILSESSNQEHRHYPQQPAEIIWENVH